MGQGGRIRHTLPTLHLLSRHGHCSFQSLHPILVPSTIATFNYPRLLEVDPSHRNLLHVNILVPVRLLSSMAQHSNMAAPHYIRAGLPHHHHAPACANYSIPLGNVHQRPWRIGKLPPTSAPHNHGRRMSRVARLHTRGLAVPGRTSPLPLRATSQSPEASAIGHRLLQRNRYQVQAARFRRRQQGRPRQTRGSGRTIGPDDQMSETYGGNWRKWIALMYKIVGLGTSRHSVSKYLGLAGHVRTRTFGMDLVHANFDLIFPWVVYWLCVVLTLPPVACTLNPGSIKRSPLGTPLPAYFYIYSIVHSLLVCQHPALLLHTRQNHPSISLSP